jgi:sortase A
VLAGALQEILAREVRVFKRYWTILSAPYKKERTRRQRMVSLVAMILTVAGLGFLGYFLVLREDALVPRVVSSSIKGTELAASAKDTTLFLTVPKMARVEDLPVYDAPWNDETALDNSATHVQGTDFPWQQDEEANVYIAGHRVGFPGTKSFLVFYDLDKLEEGDEVLLTDSSGTQYAYKVFDKYTVDPYDWNFTEPAPGESILTLLTCTLPDYKERLVVQAELTEAEPG